MSTQNKKIKTGFTDVMIDLETCSTETNALICTIGIVKFNLFDPNVIPQSTTILVDKADAENAGLHISESTMSWWERQPEEAKYEAFNKTPRLSLRSALDDCNAFCKGMERYWCQGTNFDVVVLEQAMKTVNVKPVWKFWQWRDCRTVSKMVQSLPKREGTHHSAEQDALYQVACLRHVFSTYNINSA